MASRRPQMRRATDRVEDWATWILMAAGLLVIVGSVLTGLHVRDQFVERSRSEAADRTPAVARLVADALTITSQYSTNVPVMAPATWNDHTGREHSGLVSAPQGLRAGSAVTIWTDPTGAAVPPPTSASDAVLDGLVLGGLVLGVGSSVLLGLWALVRWATTTANRARWEREWREVAPEWTRGRGTPG